MSTWDPGGILEPNVEIDVVKPQYKFGGQKIQWGEAFAGGRTIPGIDPLYMLAFTAVNPGFDILQWFIDTYGISNIPDSNRIIYFNDSGTCNYADSTFALAIEWNAGKCCFVGGFTNGGSMMDSYIIGSWTAYSTLSAQYSYTGCDLSHISERDHQLATCLFFKHTSLSPDATESSPPPLTAMSSKTYMIYNMRDKNGNPPPLTGPNVNFPTNYEGYGWGPGQIASQIYQGYPLSAMFIWTEKNPPAFMYELIENYVEDTAETGGGFGDYGFYSDSIGFADLPSVGFTDTGFGGLYAPTLAELQNLSAFLWSDSFLDNIKCNKDNAMNCIINLGLLPLELAAVRGTAQAVKAGNVSTGVSMTPLTDQYLAVDMGTIKLTERWGTCLDYEPLTVIECYLPFVGYVQIPTSELMGKMADGGGKVSLQYNVNLLTGDFVAQLRTDNRGAKNVLAQHTGNMMFSLPFSGANYTSYYKNIVGSAVQMVGQVITGNIGGAISAAASTAVDALAPQTVQRSGTLAGGSAIMGGFTPYLILRQPVQHLDAAGYGKLEGFPSYVYRQLSTVSGYVEVEEVKMDGFTGTQEEAAELEQLLKGGVYL